MTAPASSLVALEASSAVFRVPVPIRFAHCDAAGIIFFPQYLVLFNGLVEDWFNDALHVPYAHMIGADRIGLPIVRLETDFRAITRMGEVVQLQLQVEKLGTKSLTLALTCLGPRGDVRVSARKVLVFTSLHTHHATPVPAHIRHAITQWMAQAPLSSWESPQTRAALT